MPNENKTWDKNPAFVAWYEANLKPVQREALGDDIDRMRYYCFLAFIAGEDEGYGNGYNRGFESGLDSGYEAGYDSCMYSNTGQD